ncbi:MAG: PASTA domain-containing protein, partial [Clostridiales bacterium]|nr:PASTA domain-containing protein [Clostridiales bacterium]
LAIDENALVTVPDVVGLSVVEANRLIRSSGLVMTIEGSGIAVSQKPAAGERVTPTTRIAVKFSPP